MADDSSVMAAERRAAHRDTIFLKALSLATADRNRKLLTMEGYGNVNQPENDVRVAISFSITVRAAGL